MDFDLDAKTDEDFFGTLKRQNNNLGHLFDYESQRGEEQETLKYQPTKPTSNTTSNTNKNIGTESSTSNTTNTTTTVQAWKTLLAKVAKAYREGVSLGKVGVALLQNAEKHCRIIVYKAKLNVLTTCSLHAEVAQIHRRNNYLQFYDDDLKCWSIYFEADTNTEEFVAKLNELNIEVSETEKKNDNVDLSSKIEYEADEKPEFDTGSNNSMVKEEKKPSISASKPTKTHITRMAKMGQPLPKLPTLPGSIDATDSSDAETISTPMPLVPLKHTTTTRSANRALAKPQPLPANELSYFVQPNAAINTAAITANLESQYMQMMLTEHRTYNSELRMNMGKLESKVDKVLDKIDLLHSSSSDKSPNKEDELLALEEKLLELKKENRRLRQVLEEKSESTSTISFEQIMQMYSAELAEINLTNVDSLERLVGDLLQQRASLQKKLEQWERDLALKSIELKTHQIRLEDDQDTLAKTITKNDHLEVEIKSFQKRLTEKEKLECDLRHQLAESNKDCIVQRQQYEECKQKVTEANELICDLQEQIKQLKFELENKTKSEMVIRENQNADNATSEDNNASSLSVEKQIETVLKKTMNNLYGNLATKLENIVPMQKNAVIAMVGKTIRDETLKTMDELRK